MNINNLSSQTFIRDICKDFNITRIEDSMAIDLKSDTTGVFYTFEKGNRYVQPFIYRLDKCDSIKQKAFSLYNSSSGRVSKTSFNFKRISVSKIASLSLPTLAFVSTFASV